MKLSLLSVFLLSFSLGLFSENPADKILGVYYTRNKDSKVRVYKQGDKYFGQIVWLKNSVDEKGQPLTDVKNPNLLLKSKPLVSLVFMRDFVYKDGAWVNGDLYTPKYGVYVDGFFKILPDGDLEMSASYYFIFRTEIWKRIK